MDKPNLVLIVLDAVRRDHLSCYGYHRPTTPHVDRIAAEGCQFTRAYAASCWTLPSHASLFTGLYPSQHRADFDTRWLDPRHMTIAAYLKAHGYRTANITCNSFVSGVTNLDRGFELSTDVEKGWGGKKGLFPRGLRYLHAQWRRRTRIDRGGRRATRRAVGWLRNQRKGQPFFLFLNYMDCHLPYRLTLPERYQFVAPEDRQRADQVSMDPFAHMAGRITLSAQDVENLKALYDGCLAYLDAQVGLLYEQLATQGLLDDTVFMVTSDHGESFGEHGLMDHQYGLFEHLLAVPLVVRWPGGEQAGQQRHGLVQLTDVFPTLVQQIGESDAGIAPPVLPGHSLLEPSVRDAVFAEYLVPNLRAFQRRFPGAPTARYNVALRAIRTEQHKLIVRSDGDVALYDLEQDPGEANNLAGEQPGRVRQLQERLHGQLGAWPGLDSLGQEEGMDEVRDRLQELGYF